MRHRWFRGRGYYLVVVPALIITMAPFVGTLPQAQAAPVTRNAPQAAQSLKPQITNSVKHDTSPALRTVKPARAPMTKAASTPLAPHAVPHARNTAAKTGSADVQNTVTTNAMPAPQQNFEGVGNIQGVMPPDTQGDVGPNNYVQMVNLSLAIYNKQGGLLYGPVPNTTLWQGFGGPCETFNGGDPVTLYDESANRWFMSQLAYPGGAAGYHECMAVSQTGDPTGAWYRYDFLFSQTTLNDYPKFGIWPDAYYMSANEFLNGQSFTGVSTVAFERAKMLAGQDAREVTFHIGTQYGSLLPADAQGGALGFDPPAGAPEPFLMFDDDAFGVSPTDRLLMWDFHVDWSNPANSTFGNNGSPNRFFETAPFDSNLCNYNRSCIPQPGTSVGLDTLADRLMYSASYRNFGDHQSIVLNHTVDVNGADHAGIRWYQLNESGSTWSLAQQGTYAPDSDNRWMGSAAIDASGDIALGYSVSSSTTYPSIRLAGRLAGDPAGQLSQGETTLIAGGGSQTNGLSRWGDYSSMQVDPTDGCTFWFTSEYMPTTSSGDWHTRIGSFKFPTCTAGPHGDITGTVTDGSTHQPLSGALVSTGSANTTTDAQGHYSLTLPVASYNLTFSDFGYADKTVNGVAVTDGGTTTVDGALSAKPTVHVTGKVTDGSGQGYPLYASIAVTGRPGGPIWTDPATGQYSVDLPQSATYALKVTSTLPGYQVISEDLSVGTSNVTHDVAMPILATCTAPGYHFAYGTPAISEPFDATTPPAGWTVVDNKGNGQTWSFNNPGNRTNATGGQGNFAIIDSDHYGLGNSQDSSLVSPVLDLSAETTPVIRFRNDYFGFPNQVGDVDVTTDGGQTWTNAWHHGSDSKRGPDLEEAAIPQAGGHSAVQVRFHFTSAFGWWWEVDDFSVLNRSCDPIPGGLVVGTVNDANIAGGINGATVTSTDKPADKATTAATPDDPAIGDGYYWMFSSLTGAHPFGAAKAPYQAASSSVNVAANGTTRADFTLKAGQLSVAPAGITSSQVLGVTATKTVKLSNTGTAPANVKLSERNGAFQLLTKQGAPLRLLQPEEGQLPNPGWLGVQETDGGGGTNFAGDPKDPTWSTISPYPMGVVDNAADYLDGKVYSVTGVAGGQFTPKAYVYDAAADSWSPIADVPVAREKPAAAFLNGKLYVNGGWSNTGVPLGRTDVYDPTSGTWSTAASTNPSPMAAPGQAVVDNQLYLVGGCADGNCTASNKLERYDPTSDAWTTLAPYPHPVSWLSCGGISGKVYCAGGFGTSGFTDGYVYDPGSDSWSPISGMPANLWGSSYAAANGLLIISSGLSGSTLTNQGFAYDPSTDSWANLPNAQYPRHRGAGACGFFKVGGSSVPGYSGAAPESETLSELGQCGVTDVPWLAEDTSTATLQPGQSVTVTTTLTATPADSVSQPGTYAAQLAVGNDTPYKVDPVNITMTVTPPTGWGKIAGTATGTDCKGNSAPLRGVQVQANGKSYTFSLSTAADGTYGFWAPANSNPFQLIASKDKWIAQAATTNIKANKTVTVDFALHAVGC